MVRGRLAVAVGWTVLALGCAPGGEVAVDLEAERQAIIARGDAMLAAENVRDFATSQTFYTADAVIQAPNTPEVRGREAISAMYAQMLPQDAPESSGSITERSVEVAASGDLAWERGLSTTTIQTPGGPWVLPGKHFMIWRKVDGLWHVAALSWSTDLPPAPMP